MLHVFRWKSLNICLTIENNYIYDIFDIITAILVSTRHVMSINAILFDRMVNEPSII